jgi:hypothetical protein
LCRHATLDARAHRSGLWAIGDLNGKMMLAHAASAQGISAVENMCGNEHVLNHDAIPAACFTHPEIAMVGPTEEQARERAEAGGYEVGVSQGSFKANSKALAEGAGEGIAKVIFRKDTHELIAVHIVGLHAADLIQECANAIEAGSTLDDLAMMVHTHPTLCEVLDEVRAFEARRAGLEGATSYSSAAVVSPPARSGAKAATLSPLSSPRAAATRAPQLTTVPAVVISRIMWHTQAFKAGLGRSAH